MSKDPRKFDFIDIIRELDPWMEIPGVIGVSQSEHLGKPIILVMVSNLKNFNPDLLPESYKTYKVMVKETGEFNAL